MSTMALKSGDGSTTVMGWRRGRSVIAGTRFAIRGWPSAWEDEDEDEEEDDDDADDDDDDSTSAWEDDVLLSPNTEEEAHVDAGMWDDVDTKPVAAKPPCCSCCNCCG